MLARKVRRVRKKLRNMKEARGGKGLSQPVRKLGEEEKKVKGMRGEDEEVKRG